MKKYSPYIREYRETGYRYCADMEEDPDGEYYKCTDVDMRIALRVAKGILAFPLAWNRLKCWLQNETKRWELPDEEYVAIHRVKNLVRLIENEFDLSEIE